MTAIYQIGERVRAKIFGTWREATVVGTVPGYGVDGELGYTLQYDAIDCLTDLPRKNEDTKTARLIRSLSFVPSSADVLAEMGKGKTQEEAVIALGGQP